MFVRRAQYLHGGELTAGLTNETRECALLVGQSLDRSQRADCAQANFSPIRMSARKRPTILAEMIRRS